MYQKLNDFFFYVVIFNNTYESSFNSLLFLEFFTNENSMYRK